MKRRKLLFATLVCCLIAMLSGFSACGGYSGNSSSSSSSSSSEVTCEHELETIEAVAATCTTDGHTEGKKCTKCGETVEEPTAIPALGHDLIYSSTKTAATCSSKGLDVYVCSRCEHTEEKESAMKEHTPVKIDGRAATCTTDGLTDGEKCKECGKITVEQKVIPATDHKWKKVSSVAATCTSYAHEDYECEYDGCTAKKTETDVKAGYAAHDLKRTAYTAPTCTQAGSETKECTHCDHEETAEIKALGHTEEKIKGRAATCENGGLTDGKKCSVCQKILEEQQEIAALGHEWGEAQTIAATCTALGYTKKVCARCEAEDKSNYTSTTAAHTWVPATCEKDGYCSVCAAKGETAKGHTYSDAEGHVSVTKATCTEDGKKVYTCTAEGCTHTKEEKIAALGHKKAESDKGTYQKIAGTTCYYERAYMCTECEASFSYEKENVYIHNWDNKAKIDVYADCTHEEQRTYTCEDCGETQTVTGDKNPDAHTWVSVADNENATHECSACHETKFEKTYTGNSADVSKDDLQKSTELNLNGTSISFDDKSKEALSGNENVSLSAQSVTDVTIKDEDNVLQTGSKIFSLTAKDKDGKNLASEENLKGGKITVKLPFELSEGDDPENVIVFYVNGEGNLEAIKAKYFEEGGKGYVTFTVEHFSYYTVTRITPAQRCNYYGHAYEETKVKATCTSDGYTYVYCRRCGYEETKDIVKAAGHTKKTISVAATCTTDGESGYECETCGYKEVSVIHAKGHSFKEGTTVDSTCKAAGYVQYDCENCEASYQIKIPQLSHEFETQTVVEPTCVTAGYTILKCKHCDHSYKTNVVKPSGHNYVQTKIVKPTCTEEGYTVYTCSECLTATYTTGRTAPTGHTLVETNRVDATCKVAGKIDYACACGYKESRKIAKLSHEYESEVTAPTCTEEGYTTYTCKHGCGDKYVADRTKATGHEYSTVVTAPTCTQEGYTTYICKNGCGHKYVSDRTEKIAHAWDIQTPTCGKGQTCTVCGATGAAATGNHTWQDGKCTVCGENGCEHDYEKVETVEPTCSSAGYSIYRCKHNCGSEIQKDFTPATGHEYNTVVTEPTCSAEGYTTYTCKYGCGHTYKSDITSKVAHTWDIDEPTCSRGQVCENCQATGKPATGNHTWKNGACTVCEKVCGHDWESEQIEATCQKAAYTIKTCKICGKVEEEAIEGATPADHDMQKTETVLATCVKGGYELWTCSVCHKEEKREETEKTGIHKYDKDGVCVGCGKEKADETAFYANLVDSLKSEAYTLKVKDIAVTCTTNVSDASGSLTEAQIIEKYGKDSSIYRSYMYSKEEVAVEGTEILLGIDKDGHIYGETTVKVKIATWSYNDETGTWKKVVQIGTSQMFVVNGYVYLSNLSDEGSDEKENYYQFVSIDAVLEPMNMSEDMIASILKWLNGDMQKLAETLSTKNEKALNGMLSAMFGLVFTEEETESGVTLTLDIDKLDKINKLLGEKSVEATIDELLGLGRFRTFTGAILSVMDTKVPKAVEKLETYGVTFDEFFEAVDKLTLSLMGESYALGDMFDEAVKTFKDYTVAEVLAYVYNEVASSAAASNSWFNVNFSGSSHGTTSLQGSSGEFSEKDLEGVEYLITLENRGELSVMYKLTFTGTAADDVTFSLSKEENNGTGAMLMLQEGKASAVFNEYSFTVQAGETIGLRFTASGDFTANVSFEKTITIPEDQKLTADAIKEMYSSTMKVLEENTAYDLILAMLPSSSVGEMTAEDLSEMVSQVASMIKTMGGLTIAADKDGAFKNVTLNLKDIPVYEYDYSIRDDKGNVSFGNSITISAKAVLEQSEGAEVDPGDIENIFSFGEDGEKTLTGKYHGYDVTMTATIKNGIISKVSAVGEFSVTYGVSFDDYPYYAYYGGEDAESVAYVIVTEKMKYTSSSTSTGMLSCESAGNGFYRYSLNNGSSGWTRTATFCYYDAEGQLLKTYNATSGDYSYWLISDSYADIDLHYNPTTKEFAVSDGTNAGEAKKTYYYDFESRSWKEGDGDACGVTRTSYESESGGTYYLYTAKLHDYVNGTTNNKLADKSNCLKGLQHSYVCPTCKKTVYTYVEKIKKHIVEGSSADYTKELESECGGTLTIEHCLCGKEIVKVSEGGCVFSERSSTTSCDTESKSCYDETFTAYYCNVNERIDENGNKAQYTCNYTYVLRAWKSKDSTCKVTSHVAYYFGLASDTDVNNAETRKTLREKNPDYSRNTELDEYDHVYKGSTNVVGNWTYNSATGKWVRESYSGRPCGDCGYWQYVSIGKQEEVLNGTKHVSGKYQQIYASQYDDGGDWRVTIEEYVYVNGYQRTLKYTETLYDASAYDRRKTPDFTTYFNFGTTYKKQVEYVYTYSEDGTCECTVKKTVRENGKESTEQWNGDTHSYYKTAYAETCGKKYSYTEECLICGKENSYTSEEAMSHSFNGKDNMFAICGYCGLGMDHSYESRDSYKTMLALRSGIPASDENYELELVGGGDATISIEIAKRENLEKLVAFTDYTYTSSTGKLVISKAKISAALENANVENRCAYCLKITIGDDCYYVSLHTYKKSDMYGGSGSDCFNYSKYYNCEDCGRELVLKNAEGHVYEIKELFSDENGSVYQLTCTRCGESQVDFCSSHHFASVNNDWEYTYTCGICGFKYTCTHSYYYDTDCNRVEKRVYAFGVKSDGTAEKTVTVTRLEEKGTHNYRDTESSDTTSYTANGYTRTRTTKYECERCARVYTEVYTEKYEYYQGFEFLLSSERTKYDEDNNSYYYEKVEYTYSATTRCQVTVKTYKGESATDATLASTKEETLHSYETADHSPAGCTENGYTIQKCAFCDYEKKVIEYANGHAFERQDEDGNESFVCSRCGLENTTYGDGAMSFEDLSAKYGNGEYYAVGIWNGKGYTYDVKLGIVPTNESYDMTEEKLIELSESDMYFNTDKTLLYIKVSAVREKAAALFPDLGKCEWMLSVNCVMTGEFANYNVDYGIVLDSHVYELKETITPVDPCRYATVRNYKCKHCEKTYSTSIVEGHKMQAKRHVFSSEAGYVTYEECSVCKLQQNVNYHTLHCNFGCVGEDVEGTYTYTYTCRHGEHCGFVYTVQYDVSVTLGCYTYTCTKYVFTDKIDSTKSITLIDYTSLSSENHTFKTTTSGNVRTDTCTKCGYSQKTTTTEEYEGSQLTFKTEVTTDVKTGAEVYRVEYRYIDGGVNMIVTTYSYGVKIESYGPIPNPDFSWTVTA